MRASAIRLLRAEHLLVIAIAFALGAMVEGGIDLWGVLFLRTHFPEGLALEEPRVECPPSPQTPLPLRVVVGLALSERWA